MTKNGTNPILSVGNGCNICGIKNNVKVLKCLHELCTDCLLANFDKYLICPICYQNTMMTSREAVPSLPSAIIINNPNNGENCPSHKQKILSHYCVSCQLPVCSECVEIDHSDMPHVVKLISETTDMFLRCLNVAHCDSMRIKSSLESSNQSVDRDDIVRIRNAVMERHSELNKSIDCALADTLAKLDALENERSGHSSDRLECLTKSLNDADRCLETFRVVFEHASDLQKVTYSRILAGKNEEIIKVEDGAHLPTIQFCVTHPSLPEYIRSKFGVLKYASEDAANDLGQVNYTQIMRDCSQTKPNPEFADQSMFRGNGWYQAHLNPDYYNVTGYSDPSNDSRYFKASRTSRLSTMETIYKFGQLGMGQSCFSSPHGFCMGGTDCDEQIFIADTNNHRIQVFRVDGMFVHTFGVSGRGDGQIWYPRKVAYLKTSGCLVVCDRGSERSRMQIFTVDGAFVRKIIIRYIDIVAGLVVSSFSGGITRTDGGKFDSSEVIVAVDSVSPTVFIISELGDLLRWFDCSDHMREPSDIIVHNDLFYICDFKGHSVVVFNTKGKFVHKIGNENITNFPSGIDISVTGDILVGDSHGNRFHVAVFSMTGELITEFECPEVKVSRCCGLKITSQGYIVTLAKNNHHVLVLNRLFI